MKPVLPPEISPADFDAWLSLVGRLCGHPLEARGPGRPGPRVLCNGEELAVLSGEVPAATLEEAASLLSLLAEDRLAQRDLVVQTARLWKELNFLTSVARALTVHATEEETARKLLGRIVRLLGVTRASILIAREDGRLVVVAAEGLAHNVPVGTVVPEGGVADRVYRSGETVLIEDIDRIEGEDDQSFLLHHDARTRSFLSVPILSGGVPIGVINVTDRIGAKPFRSEDKKLIAAIASQAGIAFANVRLLAEARRNESIRKELELAARIQRSLLPSGGISLPGWDVAGSCEPALWVGGDSFQILARPGGGLWASVADVSGHGISAALLMASARAALRALVAADMSPAEAARSMNDMMVTDAGDTGMYLTAVLVRAGADGQVALCSLGHPPALLSRRDGSVVPLSLGGAPAGIVEDETYAEDEVLLEPGERLLLYSDGVTEAEGDSGPFGEEHLARWLASRPDGEEAAATASALVSALDEHRGGAPARDDVTVVVIHRKKGER